MWLKDFGHLTQKQKVYIMKLLILFVCLKKDKLVCKSFGKKIYPFCKKYIELTRLIVTNKLILNQIS